MKNLDSLRKIDLFGIVALLFLISGFSLSAQQIITEHISDPSNSAIKYTPNFNQTNYTKVLDQNGEKVFIKNPSASQNKSMGINTVNDVNLTVNFVYDESQYYVSSVMIYDETGYMYSTTYYNLTNPLVLSVPDGTYDIMTEFGPLGSGQAHIVLKEQQSVQGNTTVQMKPTQAVNHVSITAYDENGDMFQSGTGGYFYFQRSFLFNPINTATSGAFYFTGAVAGQEPEWNFYINDVSDRYSIIQNMIGAGFPEGDYYTKFQTITGIQQAVSIANNPDNWSYHTEQFQPTQLGDNSIAPAHFTASTFNGNLIRGWGLSAGGQINPGDAPFRGFLNNPLDGDPADFLVIPAIIDRYVSYSPTTGGVQYFTKGNPVFSDGNGGVLYGSGDESFNSHSDPNYQTIPFLGDDYYLTANNKYKLLPVHPKFAFDEATAPSVVIGNNVPITVTGFNESNTFQIAYKGRYGETRESDFLATDLEVKQNGIVLFSGNYDDYEYNVLPSTGAIEISLTNANTSVDGLQGMNTTTITYNADMADAPPTLQHLQFRNSDDQVTDIFDATEGATVRLAAGDFNYTTIDGSSGYYAYQEGNNVELSYSVYDQNDWTELGLTEYPEYFQMPAFGNYYEASLDGVGNEDGALWYDLKVVCTDSEGNKQEQLISPAFKINNTCQNPYPVVTNLTTAVQPNGILLQWDPIIGSIGCRIQGGIVPSGGLKTLTTLVDNVDSYFVSQAKLKSGKTYRWHVQCGCSNSVIGDWSAWDEFTWTSGAGIFVGNDIVETADMNVFPNPVSTELHATLYGEIAGTTHIAVYDAMGSMVYVASQKANAENSNFTLDLGHLRPGIYILELKGDEMVIRKRFIKE